MTEFERVRRNCCLDIKAYQSVRMSLMACEKLNTMVDSTDHLLISSVFHFMVIMYAKPFLNSSYGRLTVKTLKESPDFSKNLHDHLIMVRNTLVAHDDFEMVEPKILSSGITPQGSRVFIPTEVRIANKRIAYPVDLESAQKLKSHIASALSGVFNKLAADIKNFRNLTIDFPDQAVSAAKFSEHLGQQNIDIGGTRLIPPDLSEHKWLNVSEPDFSNVHKGFIYESMVVQQIFHGPERIKLPDGSVIELMP